MSLPAQPNAAENNEKKDTAPEAPSAAVTSTPVTPSTPVAAPVHQDQRSYLAMMVLATFAAGSGLARAYRGNGWTRFWVYVGANVIMIIPVLGQVVGGFTLLVLYIMGIVDVFKFRNSTTDATGATLAMTPTDKKWGHGLFVFFATVLILVVLLMVLLIALAGASLPQLIENKNNIQQMNNDALLQQQFTPDSL